MNNFWVGFSVGAGAIIVVMFLVAVMGCADGWDAPVSIDPPKNSIYGWDDRGHFYERPTSVGYDEIDVPGRPPLSFSYGWGIKALGEGSMDIVNYGLDSRASDGMDEFDRPDPPDPPGEVVSMYFPHNWGGYLGDRYGTDVKLNPGWVLVVETGKSMEVTLVWDEAPFLIDGVDMRVLRSLTYYSTGKRVFVIDSEGQK